MVCIFSTIAELLRRPFSAAVSFQKQFVDDVVDSLKAQKDRYARHNRDIQERAMQLHLDSLEVNYLCCVCFTPGKERDSEAQVENAFIMVKIPPKELIEDAIARTAEGLETKSPKLCGSEDALGSSLKKTPYDLKSKGSELVNCANSIQQTVSLGELTKRNGATARLSDGDSISSDSGKRMNSREWSAPRFHKGYGGGAEPNVSTKTGVALVFRKKPLPEVSTALDPAQVPPIEVNSMINRIHKLLIKKGSHGAPRTVAPIRDKGLIMIEDSDIELFSYFFRRPVRGYLCEQCYTCVLKSLDALSYHIQTILFKAKHPLLRKTPSKEIDLFLSTKSTSLVSGKNLLGSLHQPLEGDCAWREKEGPHMAASWSHQGSRPSIKAGVRLSRDAAAIPDGLSRLSLNCKANEPGHTVLDDDIILSLRATVKCGVCQKRPCSFFVQINALFICEFCCVWDRFYRNHAICINDEAMPLKCASLLTELSTYYKQIYIQKELRAMPQTELQTAPRSLFSPEENIFHTQNLPNTYGILQNGEETPTASNMGATTAPPVIEERPFYTKDALSEARDPRALVGSTRLSLFADICLKQKGEPDLFESAITEPQTPLLEIDGSRQLPRSDVDPPAPYSPNGNDISFLFQ
ncbi:unnamed protein product [Phytomonas sp. EM1]|nr:unnamed protein product [Phytomonas sp. EM1]|eukprot:CCW62063.1 unnamed protein product [Phytomonas sp. isolate EM1]